MSQFDAYLSCYSSHFYNFAYMYVYVGTFTSYVYVRTCVYIVSSFVVKHIPCTRYSCSVTFIHDTCMYMLTVMMVRTPYAQTDVMSLLVSLVGGQQTFEEI